MLKIDWLSIWSHISLVSAYSWYARHLNFWALGGGCRAVRSLKVCSFVIWLPLVKGSGDSTGPVGSANAWCELTPKCRSVSDYKPKMNITLGGSTYTKTIDLESRDFYNMSNFGSVGPDTNCLGSSQINELPIQNNGQVIQCFTGCNEQKGASNLESSHSGELANDSFVKAPEKTTLTARSTFFSRLARRLTIRRTAPKLGSVSPPRDSVNFLKGVVEKPPPQIPTGRKIRRWFSKHLMPPSKNSLHKAPQSTLFFPWPLKVSLFSSVPM